MIHHLNGRLVEKNPTYLVIECGGVGYFVNISLHTFSAIPDQELLRIYTYLQIREDAHTLYGFWTRTECEVFKLMISVSGVGANIARTMLSSLTPEQVCDAIAREDVRTIQAVKGIGAKTAQRVILDLKDKILKIYELDEVSHIPNNTNKQEALSALEVLGFGTKQAEKAVEAVLKQDPSMSVEGLIKLALKNL
jgi:Holliday junction DNA helicase RuvA